MSNVLFKEEQYEIEDRYNKAARRMQEDEKAAEDIRKRIDDYVRIYDFFYDKASGHEKIDVRRGRTLTEMQNEARRREKNVREQQDILKGDSPQEEEFIRALQNNNKRAIERIAADGNFYPAKYYLACRIADSSPDEAVKLFEECKKSREYEDRADIFVNAIRIGQLQKNVYETTGKTGYSDYSHFSDSKREERKKIKNAIYKAKTLLKECEKLEHQEKELRRQLNVISEKASDGRTGRKWIRENEKALDAVRDRLENAKKTLTKSNSEEKKKLRTATVGRRIRRAVCLVIVVMLLVFGNWAYIHDQYGFLSFIPNVVYTGDLYVGGYSPYFVSLRPLESLWIGENSIIPFIFTPFGTKTLHIENAVRKVKVHDGTEELFINCKKLKKLTIPESVTTLEILNADLTELTIPESVTTLKLYNISDEFASTLILPEHLKYLVISLSPDLTDKGLQDLEIPKSVQYVEIDQCDGFKHMEIIRLPQRLPLLVIRDCRGIENMNISCNLVALHVDLDEKDRLESLTLSGNIDYVDVHGNFKEVTVGCTSNFVNLSYSELENLTVSGKVDCMDAYRVNSVSFLTAPRRLSMEYYGSDESVLPEGIEILSLVDLITAEKGDFKVEINHINIPSTVKRLEIRYLDYLTSLEVPDGVEYLYVSGDRLDAENLTIPESVKYWYLDIDNNDRYSQEYRSEDCPDELVDSGTWDDRYGEYKSAYNKLMEMYDDMRRNYGIVFMRSYEEYYR